MTETTETVDETAEDVDEGAAEEAAEEAGTEEDNSTEESDAEEEGTADGEEDQEEEDEEPPTRKPRTNADWVALRRQQKLEKQRKAGKEEQREDEDDDSDDEDEDDVNEEDAKLIDKRIDQRLQAEREAAQVLTEIDEFASENPDFKPYVAKAKKWAQHPSWKDIPTKQLMHAVAGDKLLEIGAKRSKAASQKAKTTKTGANSGGEAGGKKPVLEMTDEEFQTELNRVKNQPRG